MISPSYSLMIHGGAGALEDMKREVSEAEFRQSLTHILEAGRKLFEGGASALDVVEHCVVLLENDPFFNAGRGSVLNAQGQVEMDAALMEGCELRAGGVTCVKQVKNPIALARRVMEQGDHVLLAGEGALEFAKACGVELCADEYFITEPRRRQWQEAQATGKITLDHERVEPSAIASNQDTQQSTQQSTQTPPQKLGTVGAVAWDQQGNLAAATSTGGLVNKRWGRVGDTPVVGAGVFADNETCAVSATGYGEQFLRTVMAKTVSDFVWLRGMDAIAAAQAGIDYLVAKVNGSGGVIVIDRAGRCGSAQSTSGMIRGWIEHGSEVRCRLD